MPMPKTHHKLLFYERQFNTIKGLIPVANTCISESIEPDKIAKGFFTEHLGYWEITQSPQQKKLWKIAWAQEEEYVLLERMVIMMNLLVNVKKTSQAARVSQHSLKITLFELLVRLRDHVLVVNNAQMIPSFTLPEQVKSSQGLNLKSRWALPGRLKADKKLLRLHVRDMTYSRTIPSFVGKVLSKQLQHLQYLSQLGKLNEDSWAKEIRSYASLQKRALATGKEYEGKAFEIICKMLKVNQELSQAIRKQINPQYEKALLKTEKIVQYYKEKAST